MTDYYKTEKETLREAQEKANKYDALIAKLTQDNETDTKKVKYYEEAYRESKSEHDKKSYKRAINILNTKRQLRKEILANDYTQM